MFRTDEQINCVNSYLIIICLKNEKGIFMEPMRGINVDVVGI